MATNTGYQTLSDRIVKRAVVSGTGDIDVVAAVTGHRIRVLSLFVSASGAGAVTFKSATTSLGAATFKAADATFVLPDAANGWFDTTQGEKFTVSAGALTVTGALTYVEI